jgi:hypothetical protein
VGLQLAKRGGRLNVLLARYLGGFVVWSNSAFQREWERQLDEKRQQERKVEQERRTAAQAAKEQLRRERETMQSKRMEKNRWIAHRLVRCRKIFSQCATF